jgi:hypothetical protein
MLRLSTVSSEIPLVNYQRPRAWSGFDHAPAAPTRAFAICNIILRKIFEKFSVV